VRVRLPALLTVLAGLMSPAISLAQVSPRPHASAVPQIVEASHVSGNYDYLLKVVVADLDEWARITERLTANGGGVDRITTLVLLHKPKIFVGYPVPQR